MRHRIGGNIGTGFGNPSPALLPNKGELNQAFAQDALEKYFAEEEGFDFSIDEHTGAITVGIEPTYQYDNLKTITIHPNKELSHKDKGRAWESYGSAIARTTHYYQDYKYNCKFTKFVDQWHPVLFPEKTARATELKIGNCLFCNKPINHESHHRVNDKRDHAFVDPEPMSKNL